MIEQKKPRLVFSNNTRLRYWLRLFFKAIIAVIILAVIFFLSVAGYIHTHKQEVLNSITAQLNEEIIGDLTIGGMELTLLGGFPQVSLELHDVIIRDSLYDQHGRNLLKAERAFIAVNTVALLRGIIEIKKIKISRASLDLFTDVSGYTNTSALKKKGKSDGSGDGSFPELRKLQMEDVVFKAENLKMNKFYHLVVHSLKSDIDYNEKGWEAGVRLSTLVNSMAFNTRKGSFIKGKEVSGKFEITYDGKAGLINFKKNKLDIGGENFMIAAQMNTADEAASFVITIENNKILWADAAGLLSPNISSKLMMFNLKKPIKVKCTLDGGFNLQGDPLINVEAIVAGNILDTPGGEVARCSFRGMFSNNYIEGKGINDANSVIKLHDFKGEYAGIPVSMDRTYINDLERPVATGDFKSKFNVSLLGSLIDPGLLLFKNGEAEVNLNYKADIVDFKISKPMVNGSVNIKNAGVRYTPRNLNFNNVSVALNFTDDNLSITNINLAAGKSTVAMEGSIKNFLNLYYTDPGKIVLKWKVHSPRLYLEEFLGFADSRKAVQAKRAGGVADFTEEIDMLFERSHVDMQLRVDKLFYKRFYAKDVRADLFVNDKGFTVKNAGLWHAGGYIGLSGRLNQQDKGGHYSLNATVKDVDISQFFHAFTNFGMETLNSKNLSGLLSAGAALSGGLNNNGTTKPGTMKGTVGFSLKKGALLNFEPVKNVGRFAFPNRNMDTIVFTGLKGKFDIKGETVTIHPMKISSSVLNMDVAGIYSFGKGTSINVDVPIRNPKRDEGITDEAELAKRRNRGIVIHLVAADDGNGKVKIKLGRGK